MTDTAAGQGTTHNLPNYKGMFTQVDNGDTPLLRAAGARTRSVDYRKFEWQTAKLRDTANRAVTEGKVAVAGTLRVRDNHYNVIQSHQEVIEISYERLGSQGAFAANSVNNTQSNPIQDELAFQVQTRMAEMRQDFERDILFGVRFEATNTSQISTTGGVLEATTTNVVSAAGAALTEDHIEALMKSRFDVARGIGVDSLRLYVPSTQKVALTELYKDNYRINDRNIAGRSVDTIQTSFGAIPVLTHWVFAAEGENGTIALVDESQLGLVTQRIPGKGDGIFVEALAKVGASERFQLCGYMGLEWGAEERHGKIVDLAA